MIEYLVFHVFVLMFLAMLIYILDEDIGVFSPLFWYGAFHTLVFVIKPIVFYWGEFGFVFSYIGYYPADSDLTRTLVITDVALLSFIVGYYYKSSLSPTKKTAHPRHVLDYAALTSKDSITAFFYMTLILLPLIVFSLYSTGSGFSLDNSSGHQIERVGDIFVNVNTTGYVTELKKMLTPYIFLLVVIFGFRKWVLCVILAYVSYRLYLGWERVYLVVLFLNLALYLVMLARRKWFSPKFIVIVLVGLPVFSFIGENRDFLKSLVDDEVIVEIEDSRGFLEKQDNLDFANFEYLVYITSVVPEMSQNYSYWTQYLQLFTEPVPRIIWKNKPLGAPIKLVNLNEWGNFFGLTKSIVGDAWISFGWGGIIINLFFLGYLLRFLYEKMFLNSIGFGRIAWLTLLPFSMQLFRDGGIVSISKFILFAIMPLIVWSIFYRVNVKK